jgi:hypothetical protein
VRLGKRPANELAARMNLAGLSEGERALCEMLESVPPRDDWVSAGTGGLLLAVPGRKS